MYLLGKYALLQVYSSARPDRPGSPIPLVQHPVQPALDYFDVCLELFVLEKYNTTLCTKHHNRSVKPSSIEFYQQIIISGMASWLYDFVLPYLPAIDTSQEAFCPLKQLMG